MSKLESIKHTLLKNTIIQMQANANFNYYGHFALYFDFEENKEIPAPAGVTIKDRRFKFYYNSEEIDKCIEELGENFLRFLVVHEVNHILLSHVTRTGEREHQLSNIAQDMLINTAIANDLNLRFPKFYYADQDYDAPEYNHKDYTGKMIYEPLYDFLWETQERRGNEGEGEAKAEGEGSGNGKGQLVDHHQMNDDLANGNISESEMAQMEGMIKDIHTSLKAQGMTPGSIIEKNFSFSKEKSLVNIFKKVFSKGVVKESTYRKLSRRCEGLKGDKKESREINLLLDTSGSLYNELNQYIGAVVGKYSIFLIQCDTKVAWEGKVENMADWKKVKKAGGGGTILQPAIDRLIAIKKQSTPLVIVTDGYTDNMDFSKYKGHVTFVMTKDSTDPKFHGTKNVKVIKSVRS